MEQSHEKLSRSSRPVRLEQIVDAARWVATDTLVEWCRRSARVAKRFDDFDGPSPDDSEFERAVMRLLQHGEVWM